MSLLDPQPSLQLSINELYALESCLKEHLYLSILYLTYLTFHLKAVNGQNADSATKAAQHYLDLYPRPLGSQEYLGLLNLSFQLLRLS